MFQPARWVMSTSPIGIRAVPIESPNSVIDSSLMNP
jgi:hypothetical protein